MLKVPEEALVGCHRGAGGGDRETGHGDRDDDGVGGGRLGREDDPHDGDDDDLKPRLYLDSAAPREARQARRS